MKVNEKVLLRLKKLLSLVLLFTIFIYTINILEVKAVTQTREEISDKLNNYPGYKELIDKLKEAHPNWNFTIFYTGLDWEQVIKNESTARHGRNLVPSTKSNAWVCPVCGDKQYDNGTWRCASEAAVRYYMDPRNSLNEQYIFQFEALSYNSEVQTIDGVNEILKDVGYMQTENITYTKTDGTTAIIEKTYAQVIMEAAEEANVSPYHLAARIRQEQGAGDSPTVIARGTYEGFVGYYNFFNIKASGDTTEQIITNALTYAKNNNLTDPEISIKEGAKFLANNYISSGQDTLYLQKFDVDNSDGTLYYFQYMQNVSASKTEGTEVKESYKELGLLDSKIDFIIPVYENMPEEACAEPIPEGVVTQNIKVKGDAVRVRENKSTTSKELAVVNKGDELLRIEIATSTNEEHYWDKVVLPSGVKGYIARDYIEQIEDIRECEETVVVKKSVNLRNGPGTTGTTIITTLIKGQILTRVEKAKYNIDGYVWDRVILVDGRQGYVAQEYIGLPDNTDNDVTEEIIKVICNSGLKVREQPGTNQKVSTYLSKGDILTRVEKEVSNANGYIWDKVVTNDGIEGYIARGDSKEQYIEVVTSSDSSNNNSGSGNESNNENTNNEFKLQDTNLICEPNTTIESIKEKYSQTQITVKKPDGTIVETGNVGTGYVINIEDKSYTIIKFGDINGDTEADAIDLLLIKRRILGTYKAEGVYETAVDLNADNSVDAIDLLLQKRHLLGTKNIIIQNFVEKFEGGKLEI